MTPFVGQPFVMGPAPDFVASLKRKRAAIEQMCDAAKAFLCADLNEQIDRLSNPVPFGPIYSPEMLIEATTRRDKVQSQIDALQGFVKELPETQAEFIRQMQLPMLEDNLKSAETWLSQIQAGLESQAPKSDFVIQHPGEDTWRVLETPPTFVWTISRPAPEQGPGQCEIAEHEDGTLKVFADEARARQAAEQMGDDWKHGTLVLQPVAATSPNQKERL